MTVTEIARGIMSGLALMGAIALAFGGVGVWGIAFFLIFASLIISFMSTMTEICCGAGNREENDGIALVLLLGIVLGIGIDDD